jgi:hypothetical protein
MGLQILDIESMCLVFLTGLDLRAGYDLPPCFYPLNHGYYGFERGEAGREKNM